MIRVLRALIERLIGADSTAIAALAMMDPMLGWDPRWLIRDPDADPLTGKLAIHERATDAQYNFPDIAFRISETG